jgi:hypothetical protein
LGIAALVIIALVVIAVIVAVSSAGRRRKQPTPKEVAWGLRQQALDLSPHEIGLSTQRGEAWGVVMDIAYPEAVASLVSFADGSASIYFSSGGGVIGGHAHEAVANAAKAFVKSANQHLSKLLTPPDEMLPRPGYTRFFVLTTAGKQFAEAEEQVLGEGEHELSPLFYAGQEVITQLRLISQESNGG